MFVNTKRNSSVNIHLRFRHNVDWLTCGGGLCCPGMGPSQTTQVGTEKGTTDRQYWHIPIYRRKQTMGKLKQFHNKWENISKWNLIEYDNFLINLYYRTWILYNQIHWNWSKTPPFWCRLLGRRPLVGRRARWYPFHLYIFQINPHHQCNKKFWI